MAIDLESIRIRIPNFDDLICGGQAIRDACNVLKISSCVEDEWITEYISKNQKLQVNYADGKGWQSFGR